MKDLIQILSNFTIHPLKLNLELLTDGIHIPQATEEFDTFSLQGTLKLNSNATRLIRGITIQFRGFIDRLKVSNCQNEKASIIENQLSLLKNPAQIPQGDSAFAFELALPRSLPPTVNSEFFKLNYQLLATVEVDGKKIAHQIPVKVFNPYLIPRNGTLSNFFNYSGTAHNQIDYAVDFPTRFIENNESSKFSILLKPKANVVVDFVNACVFQKVVVFTRQASSSNEEELPQTISLSQYTHHIENKNQLEYEIKFKLPISGNRPQKFILPSVDSSHFDVQHTVKITIKYQLQGESYARSYQFEVPIAISVQGTEIAAELPNYMQVGQGAHHCFQNTELPPNYTNLAA
ncbi:hypothetical protein CONCODRAFT_83034 [Conidiobolus coronatus NRRL 28638]|uniref:Arrestin C-terminal-like domain-containing protein n=1 Tax=Conidiobolus coronatus (strain ATCC 28846 / CBS 209.66 / NRRL 28638) TaxID=796925 RepID=A0A137PH63_CONC2|nr:hypothetical protein CONCODRAFT_83034 [Conidiobolus coronatus NRRL 28638]|eukprot:KXN74328.1 hypothetical protein CONCODRAFT_83034 [Conidiobolus coronatus NRRL 28638]